MFNHDGTNTRCKKKKFESFFSYYFSDPLFSNKDGSVLVMATVEFSSSQTNAVVLKGLLERALADGTEINGLQFNPEFPIGKQC